MQVRRIFEFAKMLLRVSGTIVLSHMRGLEVGRKFFEQNLFRELGWFLSSLICRQATLLLLLVNKMGGYPFLIIENQKSRGRLLLQATPPPFILGVRWGMIGPSTSFPAPLPPSSK